MAPVVDQILNRGHEVVIYALPPAFELFTNRFPKLNIIHASTDLGSLPLKPDIALIGLGHPKRHEGMTIWRKIRRTVPGIVVLDHWKGLERFLLPDGTPDEDIMPQKIAVMDRTTAEALEKMGLDATLVEVTGHPLLEQLNIRKSPISKSEQIRARRQLEIPRHANVILLASEIVHAHAFHDPCNGSCQSLFNIRCGAHSLWEIIVNKTCQLFNPLFLLRPHPNESVPKDKRFLHIDWTMADDLSVLAAADQVYGLSSMFLMESVSLSMPVFNIQPHLPGWRPEKSFLRADIWEYISRSGYVGRLHDTTARPFYKASGATDITALIDAYL
jgi:hypothetical protein